MISSLVADQIDFDRATYEIAIADSSNTVANRARRDRLNRVRNDDYNGRLVRVFPFAD